MKLILFVVGALVLATAEARRVRVRPVASEAAEEEQQQIEYYAEQEEDEGPILVSRQDTYGRATGQPRYQPKAKSVAARPPPVQTIRNYNKLNDDGSFTFGYEAADGSFKEETRGTDCVVRGKYGYVDPDGNKREFTYVSGNPCDPNAVHEEEEQQNEREPDSGEENIPKNIPRRPQKPNYPTRTLLKPGRPSTTLFQQQYNQDEEENVPTPRTVQLRPQPTALPRPFPIPTFAQLEEEAQQQQVHRVTPRPKLLVSTPRAQQSVSITPRPTPANLPATTYRPQLLPSPTPKLRPSPQSISLDDELKNFQLEHNVVSTPGPRPAKPASGHTGQPIYTSELVFDPQSGQYNTVLYQQLPQTSGVDLNLRGRLQPFVTPQQAALYRPQFQRQQPHPFQNQQPNPFQAQQSSPYQSQQPSPYQSQQPNPYQGQQQLFQSQQAALVQQSQQLFAQQQKRQQEQTKRIPQSLLQQEPQRFASAPKPFPAQPFYYVSPDGERTALANGQIDAFLRGHSIAI